MIATRSNKRLRVPAEYFQDSIMINVSHWAESILHQLNLRLHCIESILNQKEVMKAIQLQRHIEKILYDTGCEEMFFWGHNTAISNDINNKYCAKWKSFKNGIYQYRMMGVLPNLFCDHS